MPKFILLDLDNTLYEYEPVHQKALSSVLNFCNTKLSLALSKKQFDVKMKIAKTKVKYLLPETAASHNRLLYMQYFCESLKLNAAKHALTLYNQYWDTFLENLSLNRSATDFLERYSHHKICLVTDLTAHIQYRKINQLGLENHIDFIVTSEETGHEKPHPLMFQLALEKMNANSDETCMIGDSFDKDIVGATMLGIKSFWIHWKNTNPESIQHDIDKLMTLNRAYRAKAVPKTHEDTIQDKCDVTIVSDLEEIDW